MSDVLPAEVSAWQWVEAQWRQLVACYGYEEIRMPLVEKTALFKRSIGDVTDIVEKEMYVFEDRNGESLALRPEGTAQCVRAGLEAGILRGEGQRLWYAGPMFRHERPQKGRSRQFHQFGLEAFAYSGPDVELEMLALCQRLWRMCGIPQPQLLINALGSPESRQHYKAALVDYLRVHYASLDEDSQRRLEQNPLRILDSKSQTTQALLDGAPCLADFWDAATKSHFEALKAGLDVLGIAYRVDNRLVRGLDYYTGTVFEWVSDHLGAQSTVCAGGRYDNLVAELGGQACPAFGCSVGVERLLLLAQVPARPPVDAYLIAVDLPEAEIQRLAERLRNQLPTLRLRTHLGGGSWKTQFKKADKSGASYAIIVGPDEWKLDQVSIKSLRHDGAQTTLSVQALQPEHFLEGGLNNG